MEEKTVFPFKNERVNEKFMEFLQALQASWQEEFYKSFPHLLNQMIALKEAIGGQNKAPNTSEEKK